MNKVSDKTKLKYFDSLFAIAKKLMKKEEADVDFHYDMYGYPRELSPDFKKLDKLIRNIEGK